MPVDIAVKNPRTRTLRFFRKATGSPRKMVNPAIAPKRIAVQFIKESVHRARCTVHYSLLKSFFSAFGLAGLAAAEDLMAVPDRKKPHRFACFFLDPLHFGPLDFAN